jgi:tetratricopeptide (TPR) repeat protein
LVLWNGFDMMPLKSLRVALSNIMVQVELLEALLPPSMVAIADKPLPKGGYTIEATKGLFSSLRSPIHTLTKADKIEDYSHFYDDYCIAHYLLGLVAKNIAFFPDEPYDADMADLAIRSFKTVFRYAPYILDDTYPYYFAHYNLGLIMRHHGHLDKAEEKFKYLLSTINPTILGLPALVAGKGRNSLEVIVLAKAHAAMFLLNEPSPQRLYPGSIWPGRALPARPLLLK